MSAKQVKIASDNKSVDLENKDNNTKNQSVDLPKESIANKTKEEETTLEKKNRNGEREEVKEEVKEEEEEEEENKTEKGKEKEKETDTSNGWMAVWDANAQAYYWWNTVTNETTWNNPNEQGEGGEGGDSRSYDYSNYSQYNDTTAQNNNPLDTLLDKIDSQVKATLDNNNDNDNNSNNSLNKPAYSEYFNTNEESTNSYVSQAHFNARTGRFTTNEDVERLNPDQFTIENRATKQMNYYFDVDSYTEECNRQRQSSNSKKRALTRKEVEYFKKMKKEKKSKRAREWLLQ